MSQTDPNTKRPAKKWMILRILGTLLAIALLLFLLSEQGWHEIWAAIRQIPLSYLALAFVFMVISRLAVSGRWYVLLRSARLKVTFWEITRITFAGLFATNFLPTTIGGDVIRFAGAVRFGLDGAISLASLVVDRLVGMAGMAMALPFGIPAFRAAQVLGNIPGGYKPAYQAGLPLIIKNLADKLISAIKRTFNALAIWVHAPLSLLFSLLLTWINMLGLFAVLYLLFLGQGQPVSFTMIAGLYSVVYFVTLIPISINGYGVQELSMTFIFSRLAGVSMANALTTALLFRTIMMIVSLPGAIVVPSLITGERSADSPAADAQATDPS